MIATTNTKVATTISFDGKTSTSTPVGLKRTKKGNEIALVACGCFWHPQFIYEQLPGVAKAVAGYTGGSKQHSNPTWDNLGDHLKALMIEYNPSTISYETILRRLNCL